MKKILVEGATNYEILPATVVDLQRKLFISNCLKRLENFNTGTSPVM